MNEKWKEEAIKCCKDKGLYNLTDEEKIKLCDRGFNELSKIDINKDEIQTILNDLRNKEDGK